MDLTRDTRKERTMRLPFPNRLPSLLLGASMALGVMTLGVSAHEFTIGDLMVDHPWSRQTPPTAAVGVGYVTITNNGSEPDRLMGGSSERSAGLEVHTSREVDGVARMRRLEEGVVIAPGETVELKPLGTHIMFTGLKGPILADQPFVGTLVFERAGALDVTFAVQGLGAPAPERDEHGGHAQ